MDDVARKVLISTKAFLERLSRSEALTPDQLTEAHMAVTALGYQLARDGYDPATLAHVRDAEHALSAELGSVLQKHSPMPVGRRWQERWRTGVGAELTAVVADAQSESGGRRLDANTERDIAQRLRDFLVSYHQPIDPTVSAGTTTTYQGGRGDRREEGGGKAIYITKIGRAHV